MGPGPWGGPPLSGPGMMKAEEYHLPHEVHGQMEEECSGLVGLHSYMLPAGPFAITWK